MKACSQEHHKLHIGCGCTCRHMSTSLHCHQVCICCTRLRTPTGSAITQLGALSYERLCQPYLSACDRPCTQCDQVRSITSVWALDLLPVRTSSCSDFTALFCDLLVSALIFLLMPLNLLPMALAAGATTTQSSTLAFSASSPLDVSDSSMMARCTGFAGFNALRKTRVEAVSIRICRSASC